MADYKISIGAELRTQDIDSEIKKYKGNVNIGAILETGDITKAIQGYKAQDIEIGSKLNTEGISKGIADYSNKKNRKNIKVGVDPDFTGIEGEIAKHEVKAPLKVKVELNWAGIAGEIKSHQIEERIKINAELNDDAIGRAIKDYKATSKIKVDIDPDFSDAGTKISNYNMRNMLTVNVKLNKTSINSQITNFQTNRNIEIGAKLKDGSIEGAIKKYTTKEVVPVSVDFKVGGTKDVDNKINSYKNVPIDIPVKLIPAKDGFSKKIENKPVKVSATVDPNEIKKDIEAAVGGFTPSAKMPIDIKLVQPKDINAQVKGLGKPTEKIDVGIKLDDSGINTDIALFKPTATLGIQPDLMIENVDDQIRAYVPKTPIKVDIKLDSNDVNAEIAKQKVTSPINVNVKLNRESINEQIKNFKTNSKIKVGVKLDFASHKDGDKEIQKGISKQIKEYETKTKIKVGVELDRNSIEQEISKVSPSTPVGLRVELDRNSINQEIQNIHASTPVRLGVELDPNGVRNVNNQLDNIRQQIQNLGNITINFGGNQQNRGIGNITTAFERASRGVYNLHKQIEDMELKLGRLEMSGIDSGNIAQYRNQLNQLRQTYEQLLATLSGQNGAINLDAVFTEIDRARTSITGLSSDIDNARTRLARDIKIDIDNGKLQGQINSVTQKFNQLGIANQEVTNDIAELQRLLCNMGASNDIESVTNDYQTFKQLLQTVTNGVNDLHVQMRELNRPEILESARESAMQRLNGLFEDGSQAAQKFGVRAQELRNELNNAGNVTGIDIVNKKIKNLGTEIKNSGLQVKTFGTRLKEQFSKYSQYLSIASVFMYATQAARSMFEQVKLIDSAMTELKKVTDENDASYNRFLKNAASKAKELGTTIDGLVSSTADFARLGYGFEDAQGLAEVANIYAVVGDEIEGVEDATQSLVSTMAAFKSEMNGMDDTDFAMSIVDKMNEVSNNFAISSGGIGEALQRSASSMAAANNTIDETIALITAANTVAQNPEKVGNAFKTMSMRIRGAKTELEEAGESTDGMAESTASLRAEIMALSGVDIMLDKNTFKSTYQIMDELSQKWQGLSDIAQASIIELVAGKHQGNVFSSLMANFDIAKDALATSLESSGSAMKEHEKWSESLEARLNKLKAAWQSFAQTFMDSKVLKVGIDLLIKFIEILDKLVDKLGLFGTIGLGAGIYSIFKYKGTGVKSGILGDLSAFSSLAIEAIGSSDKLGKKFKNLGTLAGQAGGSIAGRLTSSLSGTIGVIGAVVAVVGLLYGQYKKAKEAAAEARQETIRASNEFLEASTSFEQAYIKYSGRTNLTAEEESELESAINGTVNALGDKSSALKDVVNSSSDYVASLEAIKNAELEAAAKAATDKKRDAETELEEAAMGWERWEGSEVNISLEAYDKAYDIAEGLNSKFFYSQKQAINDLGSAGVSAGFELSKDATTKDIIEYYNTLVSYRDKLENELSDEELINSNDYEEVNAAIEKMSESMNTYIDATYEAVKAQYQLDPANGIPKTLEEYMKMREHILNHEDLEGVSVEALKGIANDLDADYGQVFDLSSVEFQARKLVGILDEYGDNEALQMETFLNMRTKVNDNDCTVGEYLSQFDEIGKMTDGWSDEDKKELSTSFGLDTDTIKQQYEDMETYLLRQSKKSSEEVTKMSRQEARAYYNEIGSAEKRINEFLGSLTAEELAAVISIKTEIDWENTSSKEIFKQIEEQVKIDKALNFKADIEVDTTALESLNTALTESASAMGLSSDSIDSLKAKYSSLDRYDASTLFEKTANGVKINREEVKKLEKEYNDLTKSEVKEHLETLANEYNDVTAEIDKCSNASERARLLSKRDIYASKIEELATYQAQLEGVTGAYQKWIDAQNTPQEYEGYQAVATSREDIKDEINRGFISSSTKEYIDLLSGEELDGGSIDDYAEAWKRLDKNVGSTSYSINEFFTVNDDGEITATGIDRFFEGIRKDFEGEVYKLNEETGEWYYDFSAKNLEEIKNQWGMGIEAIELLLEAAEAAGYNIDWGGILDDIDLDTSDFETLVSLAESAQDSFNKLKDIEDVDFNFTATGVEEATTELEKARSAYKELIDPNNSGNVNLNASGAEQMRVMLTALLIQKQQLEDSTISLNVDTSSLDESQQDIANAIEAVKNFREKYKNLEIAVTTGNGIQEAKNELTTAMGELQTLGGEGVDIAAELILGEGASGESLRKEIELAINSAGKPDIKVGCNLDETAIGTLNSQLLENFTPEATLKVTVNDSEVDEYASKEKNANGTVKWKNDDKLVVDFEKKVHQASGKVNWKNNTKDVKTSFSATGTVKWTSGNKVKVQVISEATGTANAGGTSGNSGRAFARGNWGIKGNGVALGGELGQEMVVRDGKFFTIGDDGAEFFRYKKNDIVFNATQTAALFKYGGIKGANPRGKMLASGSAYADGSSSSSGRAFAWDATGKESSFLQGRRKTTPTVQTQTTTTTTTTSWNASATESNYSKNRASTSSSAEVDTDDIKNEFEETFDWIEIAINRVERAIDQLDTKANSVYRSWSERNSSLVDEISKVGEEISLQEQARDKYLLEANKVGLDEGYAEKVRNGSISVEDFSGESDEALVEKIKKYQELYEKYLDCQDAILELQEKEKDLYQQRFDNIVTQYEGMLSIIEHEKNMIDEYIAQSEAQAHLISENYYNALISNEKEMISKLQDEKSALLSELSTQEKGTEQWYANVQAIDEVTLAIEQSNTAILEWQQSIQQLKWEQFDLLQEKISAITEEADFLVELLSNDKLFDDNGKLTDEGSATMGLHSVNYNVYMHQADLAREEAERLKKELAKDPYDTELESRYREMITLQQEHILAAEGEKEAIRDLVEEGIETQLDSLQELIDKKNELLESERDLYEYQKKVKEQTKEISTLEKQLSSYENDDSEEAQAKIQQIKVDLEAARQELEETETDRLIEGTAALLDNLYIEYEEILNQRLDNIDALIADVIAEINTDASSISATITQAAADVGYDLSTEMSTIWDTNSTKINNVITTYGDKFSSAQTTTNNVLGTINSNLQNVITQLNSIAKTNVKSASSSSAANSSSSSSSGNSNKPTIQTPKEESKKEEPKSSSGEIKVGGKINAGSASIYDYAGDTSGERQLYRDDPIYNVLRADGDWIQVRHHKLSSGVTGWFKKSDVKAYATGAKRIGSDDWAWTQENGKEFIVRPSDGAILTPVARDDSILNANASRNIWDMANSPAEFIKNNLSLGSSSIPNNSTSHNVYSQNFENIVFSLPNVRNYDELLSDMQKDPKFEKLINSMTTDRLAGKSALAKGKSIR